MTTPWQPWYKGTIKDLILRVITVSGLSMTALSRAPINLFFPPW